MWRTVIRIAPIALAGYKWWQRKQAQKKGQAGPGGQTRPGAGGAGGVGGAQEDRLP